MEQERLILLHAILGPSTRKSSGCLEPTSTLKPSMPRAPEITNTRRCGEAYTKATAANSDLLAKGFADVLEEAIRNKKAREKILDPKTEGLESALSNACASSAPWKEERSWRWKRSPHINILEASAYARLIYFAASEFPKTRFAVGLDSNVAVSAIIKGRSPSFSPRPALRRIGATTGAGCLYPSHHFFPTRLNPSDHPTRDTCIPRFSC